MSPPPPLPSGNFFDTIPLGVVILAPDYTVVSWNRTIAEWTGIPRNEILGNDIRERFSHLKDRRYNIRIQQVFDGGPAAFFSTQFHPHFIPAPLPGGGLRFQRTSVHSLQEGGETYAILFIDDVTELVAQVHAFREMKDRALAEVDERTRKEAALALANKKIGLLSSITRHDILNQVMALKFYIETMREETNPQQVAALLAKEMVVANAIERQIHFARDYQEMGIHAPGWQRVASIVERSKEALPTGNISVVANVGSIEVYADPLLEKVFYNLIDNALQYGGPTMSTIRISTNENGDGLVLTIEDDGSGISEMDKPHLFTRGYGKHTGFGLFLSREILSITDITIQETGEPGGGARFEIRVPMGKFRHSGTVP